MAVDVIEFGPKFRHLRSKLRRARAAVGLHLEAMILRALRYLRGLASAGCAFASSHRWPLLAILFSPILLRIAAIIILPTLVVGIVALAIYQLAKEAGYTQASFVSNVRSWPEVASCSSQPNWTQVDTPVTQHSEYDRHGFNSVGNDRQGYDRVGFNAVGNDRDGYDRDGRNAVGNYY